MALIFRSPVNSSSIAERSEGHFVRYQGQHENTQSTLQISMYQPKLALACCYIVMANCLYQARQFHNGCATGSGWCGKRRSHAFSCVPKQAFMAGFDATSTVCAMSDAKSSHTNKQFMNLQLSCCIFQHWAFLPPAAQNYFRRWQSHEGEYMQICMWPFDWGSLRRHIQVLKSHTECECVSLDVTSNDRSRRHIWITHSSFPYYISEPEMDLRTW